MSLKLRCWLHKMKNIQRYALLVFYSDYLYSHIQSSLCSLQKGQTQAEIIYNFLVNVCSKYMSCQAVLHWCKKSFDHTVTKYVEMSKDYLNFFSFGGQFGVGGED
jgi:hypothetical protein